MRSRCTPAASRVSESPAMPQPIDLALRRRYTDQSANSKNKVDGIAHDGDREISRAEDHSCEQYGYHSSPGDARPRLSVWLQLEARGGEPRRETTQPDRHQRQRPKRCSSATVGGFEKTVNSSAK